MENSFAEACTEVLEVLKYLPPEEYAKIPKYEIDILESKREKNYKFDVNKVFQKTEINISKKANAIILILWERYFASQKGKEKLNYILQQNYKIEEEKKKKLYNYDNIFKESKKENVALVEVKAEKWYEKIYNFLKRIFKKN